MEFRLETDDRVDQSVTHQLGRLLIACQVLEEAIRISFQKVNGATSLLGIRRSLTEDWRPGRKAQEAVKIIDAIRKHFRLPSTEPHWYIIWVYQMKTPEENALAARQSVAAQKEIWRQAKLQMDYRNSLFHGRVKFQEGEATIQAKGSLVPFTAEEFERKTNEVMTVAFELTFSTPTFVDAVRWLSDAEPV